MFPHQKIKFYDQGTILTGDINTGNMPKYKEIVESIYILF